MRLQNQFSQQYSKIGNTREQLFQAWKSFHFNKNTETLDSYVTCIRQVSTLLGYGEPHILKDFKSTHSNKTILGTFPYRRPKTSSRNSEENIDRRKDR